MEIDGIFISIFHFTFHYFSILRLKLPLPVHTISVVFEEREERNRVLKGVQKQIVQVQIPKNRYFESAYFILRPDLRDRGDAYAEMTKEANRILTESELLRKRNRRGRSDRACRIFSFLGGILLGAATVALIWLGVLLFA